LPIGSVYWHFENKEGLFAALIDYCFENWKTRHRGPENRAILRTSIAGSAANSADPANAQEAFWIIGLLFALEKGWQNANARNTWARRCTNSWSKLSLQVSPPQPCG
jgi:AcrR family transcriptional regulator